MSSIALSLEPRPVGHPAALTAFQARWWRREPVGVRMCAASVRIFGPLNIHVLEKSVQSVVRRHESLRTRICVNDGVPCQCINGSEGYQLTVGDLSDLPPTMAESEVRALAQRCADEKLDVSVGPLFEAKLLILSQEDHVFLVFVHHIVSDAISCAILNREVWTLYDQAAYGARVSLPELRLQFADYAEWQQRTHNDWLEKHGAHWRSHLAGARPVELQFDRGLVESAHPTEATRHFPFGTPLTVQLRELATREGTRLALVVCAIYIVAMSRWCDETDLVVKFVSHGRDGHPELMNMIGFLATHWHLRVKISRHDSLLDVLHHVTNEFDLAYAHRDFDRVPELIPECSTELFFDWISLKQSCGPATRRGGAAASFKTQPFPLQVRLSPRAFFPFFFFSAGGVCMSVVYRPDRFRSGTIDRFGRDLLFCATKMAQCSLDSVACLPSSP